jgi:hypothetical protein
MVASVAALSGVAAAFAGCRPTGNAVADVVLAAALAAAVAWSSAAVGWRVLLSVSAALVVQSMGSLWVMVAAVAAFGTSAWLANHRASAPVLRAGVGALLAQVALRVDWNPFFLASAIIGGVSMGALVCAGLMRRHRSARRRAVWVLMTVTGFCVLAAAGLAAAALSSRSAASDGYRALLDGLDEVGSGDTLQAAESFRRAAEQLDRADARLGGVLTLPARVVPVLAPNLHAGDSLLGSAASAAAAAADALAVIDLDQLQVVDGVIDVDAVAVLADPLSRLERAVAGLRQELVAVDSPWLLGPISDRLRDSLRRADKVAVQAQGTVAAAELAPALLGADGERRYLLAFTSPAEARGQSGLMGNWAELSVDEGRLRLGETGRTNELVVGLASAPPLLLQGLPTEFFQRYGNVGAGSASAPVVPKYWSNVTMSPDMPSVGTQMAQMYERATGRAVDGVFVLDPAAIASLLELTGPVELPEAGLNLSSANAEEVLLLGQYDRPEADREAMLSEATEATIGQLLRSTLPGPQVMAAELGPAAQGGHLSAWAARPAEQRLLELVGMDASLPRLSGSDGIGLVVDNAAANKIDSFLQTSVGYEAVVDQRTGTVRATMTLTLQNPAPSSGLPDYVIGNRLGLPAGTSRSRITVLSPLLFEGATLDGAAVGMNVGGEGEWGALTRVVEVPPGGTATLVVNLRGVVAPSPYRLVVRPQPLARPIRWSVNVNVVGGLDAVFAGQLERRSVVTADGVQAYRHEAPTR